MEEKEGIEPVPAVSQLQAGRDPASWPLERGRLIHRLLELLPEIAADDRMDAADAYLRRALKPEFEPRRRYLLEEVAAILDDPAFATLFAAHARAEVPLVGTIRASDGTHVEISGQIDRLLVEDNRVVIVDYKTNLHPPVSVAEVPLEYRAQLCVYREMLKQVYPGREISAQLLWTAGPNLMELPAAILDETFASLRPDGTSA
jgi:ATP-dependent helicase/nuclease subunit A